jgi:hypothetical protein
LAVAFGQVIGKPMPILDGRIPLLASVLTRVYFLHFAGRQDLMEDLRYIRIDKLPFTFDVEGMKAQFLRHFGAQVAPPASAG